MGAEDDLGLVVRGHIHVEHELREFIKVAIPKPDELGRMEYSGRVRLALACGLRSNLKAPLNAVGKLRNDFAHQLGMNLTAERVDNIYNSMDKHDKDATLYSYSVITPGSGPEAFNPRARMVMLFLCLWAPIVAETRDRRGDPPEEPHSN